MKHNQQRVEGVDQAAGLKHSKRKANSMVGRHGLLEGDCCQEWGQILKCYQSAAKAYGEAAAELPVVPGAKFNRAWGRCEKLRQASQDLRADFFDHEHKHGCARHVLQT